MKLRARFEWKLQDLWIGAFWKTERTGIKTAVTDLWICFLPCVPLHVAWEHAAPEEGCTCTDPFQYPECAYCQEMQLQAHARLYPDDFNRFGERDDYDDDDQWDDPFDEEDERDPTSDSRLPS